MPPSGQTMSGSIARTERTGPTFVGRGRVEDRPEAGDAALDDLLVDDVGLVEPGLRARLGRVLDLHRERRAASARRRSGSGRPVSGAIGTGDRGRRRARRRGRRFGSRVARRRRTQPATQPRAASRDRARAGDRERATRVTSPRGRLMRSSSGGCVSNSAVEPRALLALLVAVERRLDPQLRGRLRARGARRPCRPGASSAPSSRPGGYRVSCTPVASARSSRLRLIANCISCAANGASTSSASATMAMISAERRRRRCCRAGRCGRRDHMKRSPMSASSAIVPTAITATVVTRMS